MSTETPDNTSTPETNDNQTVFAPLGKYAIVAVIMVSIIVTTAIMLDKQLNTAEHQVAAIQDEVAEKNAEETTTGDTVTADNSEPAAVITSITESNKTTAEAEQSSTYITKAEVVAIDAQSSQTTTAVKIPVVIASKTPTKETASAATATTNDTSAESAVEVTTESVVEVTTELVTPEQENSVQAAQSESTGSNFDIKKQDRLAAYKAEQKQRLTDMFTRIKALDAQRLDQYKAHQDEQIEHLRGQIAQQQQMIDTLIVRNKDLFELRAARLQRNQSNREQILNRI